MRRRTFLKESIVATAGFAVSPWLSQVSEKEPFFTRRENILTTNAEDLPVVILKGSPRQRGQIHGETLRSKISDIIQSWKEDLHQSRKMAPDEYIDEFIENTNFTKAIHKRTPGMLEEVKGIAEGSGIDYKTIFAFQLPDEEWWYGLHKRYDIPVPEGKHCSALGVFNQKGLPSFVAQNMDIPSFYDGFEVLLRIKHQNSSLESYVFTCAGLIALVGMNSHAVGMCCNALLQLDHRADGLPVAFIHRGVLEQTTYEEAVKFIHHTKHASGQNYIIGDRKKAASFECSANKVSQLSPYENAARLYHTNHPLVNDDQSIYRKFLEKIPPERRPKPPGNSEIRYNLLERRLKDPSKRITVETIKNILSSHDDPKNPVCRHKPKKGRGAFTSGCLIMELADSPVLHLAPGPPCSTEFKVYKF